MLAALVLSGPSLVRAKSLLAIFPIENTRITSDYDWFGSYVEGYLRANLTRMGQVDLISFEVLRTAPEKGPLVWGGYRLGGTYQKVGRLVQIKLALSEKGEEVQSWERTFKPQEMADQLQALGKAVLERVAPGAQWPANEFYLDPSEETASFFKARHKRFTQAEGPSLQEAYRLFTRFGEYEEPLIIAEVATQLYLASINEPKEMVELLKKGERLLRRGLVAHPDSAELLAALALGYYLTRSYPSFIEKTAEQALRRDSRQDLALWMKILSVGMQSGQGHELLLQFRGLNPYGFGSKARLPYLHGIFKTEMARAETIIQQVENPDPMNLQSR